MTKEAFIGDLAATRQTLGRTPGPWGLRGVQIRAAGGYGRHVATYQVCAADGRLLAAAPTLLELLTEACEALDAAESASASHVTADRIRERLVELLGEEVPT